MGEFTMKVWESAELTVDFDGKGRTTRGRHACND
jgi:hypothetical protein